MKCIDPEYKPEYYSTKPQGKDPRPYYGWVTVAPYCPCEVCTEKWNHLMVFYYGYGKAS